MKEFTTKAEIENVLKSENINLRLKNNQTREKWKCSSFVRPRVASLAHQIESSEMETESESPCSGALSPKHFPKI